MCLLKRLVATNHGNVRNVDTITRGLELRCPIYRFVCLPNVSFGPGNFSKFLKIIAHEVTTFLLTLILVSKGDGALGNIQK